MNSGSNRLINSLNAGNTKSFENFNFDFGLGTGSSAKTSSGISLAQQKERQKVQQKPADITPQQTAEVPPKHAFDAGFGSLSNVQKVAPTATPVSSGGLFGAAGLSNPVSRSSAGGDPFADLLGTSGRSPSLPKPSNADPFAMSGLFNALSKGPSSSSGTPLSSMKANQNEQPSSDGADLFADFTSAAPSTGSIGDGLGGIGVGTEGGSLGSTGASTSGSHFASGDPFAGIFSATAAAPAATNPAPAVDDFFGQTISQSTESAKAREPDPFSDFLGPSAAPAAAQSAEPAGVPSDASGWGDLGWGEDTGAGTAGDFEGDAPPPGLGLEGLKAKADGYYKGGQYGDAIQWYTWTVARAGGVSKGPHTALLVDVLLNRATCHKEVGENKKAVADCSQVLELDDGNNVALATRAFLYESIEKYKQGLADLQELQRRDPSNRDAVIGIARLTKTLKAIGEY